MARPQHTSTPALPGQPWPAPQHCHDDSGGGFLQAPSQDATEPLCMLKPSARHSHCRASPRLPLPPPAPRIYFYHTRSLRGGSPAHCCFTTPVSCAAAAPRIVVSTLPFLCGGGSPAHCFFLPLPFPCAAGQAFESDHVAPSSGFRALFACPAPAPAPPAAPPALNRASPATPPASCGRAASLACPSLTPLSC